MGREGRRRRALILLAVLLPLGVLVATALGAVSIPPLVTGGIILDRLTPFSWGGGTGAQEAIILQIRLPRVMGGVLVGSALAVAGVLFQGLLRNPLADPYVLGTSAGAALGATVAMLFPISLSVLGFGLVPLLAFLGAMAAVLVVYNLARTGGQASVVTLLLAGLAVSSFLAGVMVLLVVLSGQLQIKLPAVFAFLLGGISVTRWSQLAIIAPVVAVGVVVARWLAFHLNVFSLGEEGAATLGIEVEREKLFILILGSLLTAAAVSISGLIGFVGLMVPHALRLVLGPDHRPLIPAAALGGALFLLMADLGARTFFAPNEIPVGVLTGLIGAPFFLFLLRRYKRGYIL